MQDLDRIIEYFPYDSDINLDISVSQNEFRDDEVQGVQFDLLYNTRKIIFNELTSLVDGATFEYVMIDEGKIRCVIFNLNGESFSMFDLSKLIVMSFSQKNNFFTYSDILFENLIVVGNFGKDISSNYTLSPFRVDFSNLKPTKSYIHRLDENFFQDSIKITFQTHENSNVKLNVFDVFGLERKTIIDRYLEAGYHEFSLYPIDKYDDFFLEGKYNLILTTDYGVRDSIYVVYIEK